MDLARLRIKTRIYAGFGLLVALAVAVAVFGGNRLGAVGSQVDSMSVTAEHHVRLLQSIDLLEIMRRNALRFSLDSDAESLRSLRNTYAKLDAALTAQMSNAKSAERRAIYQDFQSRLPPYAADVDRLEALRTETDALIRDLQAGGEQLDAATHRLLGEAAKTADAALATAAIDLGNTTAHVRIMTRRSISTADPGGPAAVKADQSAVEAALGRLEQMADDDTRAMIPPFKSAFATYADNSARLTLALLNARTLFFDQMVPKIAAMQAGLATAAASLKIDFDAALQAGRDTVETASWMQAAVTAIVLAVGLGLALVIGRGIVGPLAGMTATMRRLADGDTSAPVPSLDAANEIGDMARAVEVFKASMISAARLAAEQAKEQAGKQARQEAVDRYVAGFDRSVRDLLDMLASSATEMRATAESMADTANQTNEQASTVAAAAEQASANVQTMAAATEEMAASAGEISRQVARSTQIASQAVEAARATDRQVQGLADAARKIEDVVAIINGIAGQTNLLALNATIEAARAGDAGKGFAVVASEVKALAGQTGKATEQIGAQIQAIQAATKEAVEAINAIGATINTISDISTSIATAVEEQGATTNEMTRNTQQAAQGTQNVSATIAGVSQGAAATGSAASQVLSAASELGAKAETLRAEVSTFLDKIKAA